MNDPQRQSDRRRLPDRRTRSDRRTGSGQRDEPDSAGRVESSERGDDLRAWRVLFIVVALALAVGTHWPRLEIDLGGAPAPDKLLHAGAFGLVTLLLWMTGWIRRPRTLLLVGLAWAALDEITQGVPGLSRTVSIHDALASAVGVTLATAIVWAIDEVPARRAGLIAERRLRWSAAHAVRGSRSTIAVVVGGLAGGTIGALVATGVAAIGHASADARNPPVLARPVLDLLARLFGESAPGELPLLGLGVGALIGAHFAIEVLRRRVLALRAGACIRCGTAMPAAPAEPEARDDDGWRHCARCGEPRHAVAESLPPLPARVIFELLVTGAVLMATALVGVIIVLWIAVATWAHSESTRRVSGLWGELPPGMPFVLDMLWIGLVLAVIGRFLRRRLAQRQDGQAERCLGCRYDLRATPARAWRGNCPECGTPFVRVRPLPEARQSSRAVEE